MPSWLPKLPSVSAMQSPLSNFDPFVINKKISWAKLNSAVNWSSFTQVFKNIQVYAFRGIKKINRLKD